MVIGILGLAAAWLVDRLYVTPWWEEMKKSRADAEKVRGQIQAAKETLDQRPHYAAKWKALNTRLHPERETDTALEFVMGMGDLCSRAGVSNLSTKIGREQKLGEKGQFTEYAVETNFQATWHSLVKLLLAVDNEEAFLRVQRIAVTSREKEERLDVEMRVTTVEMR
jgi:hypothetical protein